METENCTTGARRIRSPPCASSGHKPRFSGGSRGRPGSEPGQGWAAADPRRESPGMLGTGACSSRREGFEVTFSPDEAPSLRWPRPRRLRRRAASTRRGDRPCGVPCRGRLPRHRPPRLHRGPRRRARRPRWMALPRGSPGRRSVPPWAASRATRPRHDRRRPARSPRAPSCALSGPCATPTSSCRPRRRRYDSRPFSAPQARPSHERRVPPRGVRRSQR